MCNDDEIKYHKEENNNDNEKKKHITEKKNGTCTSPPPYPGISNINLMIFFFLNQDMSMHLFFWANHIYISENEKN